MDAFCRGSTVGRFWLQAAAFLLLAACSVDNRPGYGLLLQVDTDLATPKDLDRVHVEITQSGTTVLDELYAIGSDDEPPPLAIPVTYRGDSAPAQFKVVGYRSGQERVERFAITTIPSARWAILRMRLQYLCVGQSAAAGGEGCEKNHTCVQGECKPATLDESELPDYQMPEPVKTGSATSSGGVAVCFDAVRCFDNASEAQLEEDCSFAINPEIGAEQLNVALRLARGGVGTCGSSGCYVPFDSDTEGFVFEPGRVRLPGRVCERLQASGTEVLGVIFSNGCSAKRAGVAVCYESNDQTGDNNIATGSSGVTGFLPDPSVGPACDGGRIKSCGMCGTQQRACEEGTWGDFGACGSEGECEVEQTRACGTDGLQTCGGDCRWGVCLGQRCNGVASRACERCGTQTRGCDNGVFAEWGECTEQRACSPGETQSCGSGGTQACGGNCEWGPCGEQECPGAPTEACGMCGSRSRECNPSSGQWSEFGECSGEGVCEPDETRSCGRGGTQICGGNCQWSSACTGQSCAGERSMACGNCGTRTRTCDMSSGSWSDWSACSGEGACEPDETRGCGRGGTQVCNGSCNWDDACTGQSCLGSNRQSCGNCGVQTRSCDGSSGQWSDWSDCTDQGECRANSVRSCGSSGTQECGEDCLWESTCGGQTCQGQGETSRACGNCGLQRRACDPNTGRLGEWGPCDDEGACAPDATRGCGSSGTQTCGDNCQWRSACTGQVCAEPPSRECGNCGTQTSTCDPNTGRANWSTCTGEGQCSPGDTQECGSSGEQVCGENCRWAATCSMQVCIAPRPSPLGCGRCGTREPRCNSDTGEWTFPMQCADEGVCTPGDSRRCGRENLGRQLCGDDCGWDDCTYECTDPLTRPCGFCGMQVGTCDRATGRVTYEDTCRNPGECMRGSTQACSTSEGSGMRVCSEQCGWPMGCTITSFECREPEGAACGRYSCGVTGDCDMATGRRECIEAENPCEPGVELPCMTDAGSGVRTCGLNCVYPEECRITSRVCTEPAEAPCGRYSCGTTGACNTNTGMRECIELEDPCEPGTSVPCQTPEGSGTRMCGLNCTYSETCTITSRVCTQPEGAPCGQFGCGVAGACNTTTGQRACSEPEDPCEPGTMVACETSEGTGVRICGDDCAYAQTCMITSRVCTQPEGAACGRFGCGVAGACNTTTGQRACSEPEDPCEPGTTVACETSEGTGVRTCGLDCSYARECTITARMCTVEQGVPCGMWSCGRTGECNTTTGQRACAMPAEFCEPGTSISCEANTGTGRRFCGQDCRYSELCQVPEMMCVEEQGVPCGMWGCGRTGVCDTRTGQRACNVPDAPCEPGTPGPACQTPEGTGVQLCGPDCRLSAECTITARVCTELEDAPCGAYQCGRTGACNPDTGRRVCNELPEPCEPLTIENCTIPTDGGTLAGVRVCTNVCEWGRCEEVVIN